MAEVRCDLRVACAREYTPAANGSRIQGCATAHSGSTRKDERPTEIKPDGIITAPFAPLGHESQLQTRDATCVILPTTQPIHPPRNQGELMRVANLEQPFSAIYNYAVITDAQEGLVLTDVNTFGYEPLMSGAGPLPNLV